MFPFLKRSYIKRVVSMNAVRKGLLGGSPMWRAVWAIMTARKFWAKVSKKGVAPVVFAEPIKEGEAWALVHVPEDSRRGRGEGRKMLIGPKRKTPRATVLAAPAIASIGKRILEAPSAARINEILGADVVSDPPPSRAQRRHTRKAEKKKAQAEERAAQADERAAKAEERAAKAAAAAT